MKYSVFAVALATAGVVVAQTPDACISTCSQQAAVSSGCVTFTNITCVCTSTPFQTAALACLKANCTAQDLTDANTLQSSLCKSVPGASSVAPASSAPAGSAPASSGPVSSGAPKSSGAPTAASNSSAPAASNTAPGTPANSSSPAASSPAAALGMVGGMPALFGLAAAGAATLVGALLTL